MLPNMNQSPSLSTPLFFAISSLACAILLCFLSFPCPSLGQDDTVAWIDYKCGKVNNYTAQYANSMYSSNLDLLFKSLILNATSSGGFSTATVNNSLFGLSLCRGDVKSSTCQFCLERITQDIKAACSYSKDAIMWFNYCFVRFSENPFLQSTDNSPRSSDADLKLTLDGNQQQDLKRILKHLMNVTIAVAYSSTKKFAIRQSIFRPDYPALYALGQCTPDLSGNDCNICLQGLLTDMSIYMSEERRGAVHLGTRCILMYDIIIDSNFLMLPFPGSPQPPLVLADDAPTTTGNLNKGTVNGGNLSTKNCILSERIDSEIIKPPTQAGRLVVYICYLLCLLLAHVRTGFIPLVGFSCIVTCLSALLLLPKKKKVV